MNDKAIRSAKLTAAGVLDKARARTAVTRAGGQIAPSKYLPDVPRQVHADGGRVLPKGYSLKVDPDRLGVLARFKGRNVGQLTLSRDRETGKLSAFQMAVHPDHQRKGLMSAMHDAAEDAFGPMEPDKTLTDQGFAFWKGYRPDAVSNNLRFHTDKLMGQTVKTPYGPGTVNSVGRTGMNATLESGNTGWARAADNEDVLRNVGIDPSTLKYAKGGAVDFLRGNHPLVPDVLYHGTARDVRSFDPQAKRSYDVDPSNPEDTDTGWFGKGHYFAAKPSVASHYAKEGAKRQGDQGANIIPAHVSLKNPFVVDMKAYDSGATNLDQALTRAGVPMHPRGWRKPSEQTAALMAMGHDGVIATREGQPKEYVAFRPEQIKSAISATTFDPNDPDMTRAEGGRIGKAYGGSYVPQNFTAPQQLTVAQVARPAQQQGPSPLEALAQLAELNTKKPEETAAAPQGSPSAASEGHPPAEGVSTAAQAALDALRKGWSGAPISVISDYRDPTKNQAVGGAKGSQHLHGNAFDVDTTGWTEDQKLALATNAYNAGFRGFGFYGNNLHFDVGGQRAWGPSYHQDSIPDWAQPWAQQYIYASGGRVGKAGGGGIEAYHGSPHDFDQFDISKLGTGEGAQAYGHGLYFAGDEGVAQSYKKALAPGEDPVQSVSFRGNEMPVKNPETPIEQLVTYMRQVGYSPKDAFNRAEKTFTPEMLSGISHLSPEDFATGMPEKYRASGHMYKVKLNVGPHELLDWDKPLSEQHPNVQAALARIDPDQWHPTGGDYDPSEQGQMAYQRLVSSGNKQGAIGEHLRAGNPMKRGDKWASEALMAQGIKGIRYRDAGSRGDTDGDPTHNYVMFHHDPVQVTQKYAYGGAAKAGGGEIDGVGNNQIGEIGNAQAAPGSGQVGPQALGLLGSGGVRGGQGVLPAPSQASGEEDLIGLPKSVKMPKLGQTITAGHDPRIRQVSRDYARTSGIDYTPPTTYQKVDPARAKRIADAYEAMPHDPRHPLVKASYNALLNETKAQYDAMKRAGVNLEFYPDVNNDPYKSNPRLAVEDIRKNNHMYVYPTDAGYGTGDAMPDLSENPMLGDSGERWNGKPVMFNDLFRAVHDYFGHAKEGVGFRADGEENAWRQHAAMFSPLARIALATETRGQNSWLNYGPHGDKNRTAATEDTVFAPQKLGVLPIWAHHEGAEDFIKPQERAQMEAIYRQYSKPVNKALELTRRFTKDGAAATMALKSKGN